MRPMVPWLSSLILHGLLLSGLFVLTSNSPDPSPQLSLDFQLVLPEVAQAVDVERVEPPRPVAAVRKPQKPVAEIKEAAPSEIIIPPEEKVIDPPEENVIAPAMPLVAEESSALSENQFEHVVEQDVQYAKTVKRLRGLVLRGLMYPTVARRQGWQGKLELSFILCADGSVEDLQVYESSGYKVLDRAALRAVAATTPFSGEYSRTRVRLPISFKLN